MIRPPRAPSWYAPLAVVALLALGSCGPSIHAAQAKIERDLGTIRLGLIQYSVDHGGYPDSLAKLEDPADSYPRRMQGQSQGLPRDPWNRPYRFEEQGGKVRVVCYGSDGKPGGAGADADARTVLPARTQRGS